MPTFSTERFRADCVAGVIDAFPGLPLVGYEAGHVLGGMRALGFEVSGRLRIWVRTDDSTPHRPSNLLKRLKKQ